jgi:hypothetical protein
VERLRRRDRHARCGQSARTGVRSMREERAGRRPGLRSGAQAAAVGAWGLWSLPDGDHNGTPGHA